MKTLYFLELDDIFSDCKEKFNDLDKLFIETIETIETNKSSTPVDKSLTSGPSHAENEQRSRSFNSNIEGFIISRVQNESISHFQHEKRTNNMKKITQSNNHQIIKQPIENDSKIKINLPKSINKDTEKISTGLVIVVDDTSDNKLTNSNNIIEKPESKLYINETPLEEKKQGSFKKVINRIVESGFNVTKSRSHQANKTATVPISQDHNNFELINGFESPETTQNGTKITKRNSIFKSNSLTRKNSIGLAKNSAEIQQQKPSEKEPPTFLFNGKVENGPPTNADPNNTDGNDLKIRQSKLKKSNSLSASLPSRNFKFKEDIKSLFDKFTNPSNFSSNKNKSSSQMSSNEGISSIVYSSEPIDKTENIITEKQPVKPEIVKIYRNEINSLIQRNNSQKVCVFFSHVHHQETTWTYRLQRAKPRRPFYA
jgi:hypothetical protein